ncbi:MAG TPA: inositol monophosphatase, partial [Halomonas sp.]|nr:inositol monophosphatase [Halomonas sp.]
AREAGARVGHLSEVPDGVPADLYPEQLLVTTPKVYDAMASLLKAADHA